MKTSIKASLIAAAIASFPLGSYAAGLGQINVFSGLGQPLRAEIQISATPQELSSITAKVASPDAFRQANIPYPGFLSGIRVSVERSGSRQVVKLSSDRPINEPFVGLLIELGWASGSLSREYTFLLDPVDIVAPKPVAARIAEPAPTPRQVVAAPTPAARPATPDRYTVQRGDTLRRIAEANRPASANLDQMLIALFRANPSAFDGDNISRLRAGAILTIPDANAVQSVTPAEARREVVAQAADFEAYRQRLAGKVGVTEKPAPQAEQASSGRIVPKVEDARAPGGAGDKLQISKTQDGANAGMDKGSVARLQALEEELVAREKGLEEANARLAQLEQSIRELQKLLELKSQSLAQLQPGASGDTPAAPAPATEAPVSVVAEPAAPVAAVSEPAPAEPAAQPPAPAPTPAAAPPAAAPVAAKPAPTPKPAAPDPAPEPDFLQSLLADPAMLAAGGGVVALLLGLAAYRSRQRKKAVEALDSSALMSEFPPDSSAVFGATGGQSVDTGNSSILQTDFSQSGLSSIDADEGVDPVAEADVYMAYGRDAQAEEILEDALKTDPNRAAIYLKLLEVYAQRQSLKQFETTASELYSRTGGQGADWEKAAQMGRKLDPDNPLYAAQAVEGERTVPPKTEMPVELAAAATAAAAAASVAAPASAGEAEDEKAPDETGQALSSLDFTTSMPIEPSPSQLKDTWTMPGELGQIAAGEAEAPEAEIPAVVGADMAETIDMDSIDFDLGGDEDVPAAQVADAEGDGATVSDSIVGPDSEMDLELDDEFAVEMAATEPEAAAPELPEEPAAAPQASSTSTIVGDELSAAAVDEPALEFDLPELGKGSDDKQAAFDMSATVVGSELNESESDDTVMDLEKTSFDADLLDFDFDLETPSTPAPGAVPPGMDLTSIDLDLEPHSDDEELAKPVAEAAPVTAAEPAPEAAAAPEVDGEINHEVETKLELARAYDEMGDKEGALELLNEVLAEGSAKQQDAARALIEKLA